MPCGGAGPVVRDTPANKYLAEVSMMMDSITEKFIAAYREITDKTIAANERRLTMQMAANERMLTMQMDFQRELAAQQREADARALENGFRMLGELIQGLVGGMRGGPARATE